MWDLQPDTLPNAGHLKFFTFFAARLFPPSWTLALFICKYIFFGRRKIDSSEGLRMSCEFVLHYKNKITLSLLLPLFIWNVGIYLAFQKMFQIIRNFRETTFLKMLCIFYGNTYGIIFVYTQFGLWGDLCWVPIVTQSANAVQMEFKSILY